MTIVQTVTTNVIHRAWSDLEPKLLIFLATGLSAAVITEAANYIGYPINPGLAILISTLVSSIFGYLKSSTTKVLTPVAIVTPVSVPVVVPNALPLGTVSLAPVEVIPPAL
jgi:hypothetical protein